MNWSILIAKKIIASPQHSFSRFIIRLSVVATAISVAAMIVTLCLVNGFQATISQKVFSFWGHIHVQAYDQGKSLVAEEIPFDEVPKLKQQIMAEKGVAHVQVFATKSAILKKNNGFEGVVLKGISKDFDWGNFASFLQSGKRIDFSDTVYSHQLIISKKIADKLGVATNDSLLLYFLRNQNDIQYRKVKISGVFSTGIDEYDNSFALADIRLLRRMNLWDSTQIGGYEVWVNDLEKLGAINDKIFSTLPDGLNSLTIRQQYPNIFDWLDVQHKTKWIVIAIMAVVAIINLITCLLILVLERTRMIGLLQSLGAGNFQIQRIFLYYACYISLLGLAFGSLLGLGICAIEYFTHFIPMDQDTYYVNYAPVAFDWLQISAVLVSTAIVCFSVLIIPSFLVVRITPVKALRFQ